MKAHTRVTHISYEPGDKQIKNSKFIITQIGTLFNPYNFALWNKPTYTPRTCMHSYMHICICVYTYLHTCIQTYGRRYIHTYIHINIHSSSTYESICIFTDIVTCPSEPSKTQRRKVPHTTGKYITQYLLLAQKIKISSKVAKTQQHQQGPHSQACVNETIILNPV
jgi:hypothetical protein